MLRRGDIEFLQATGKTLLYRRFDNKKEVFVLFNLEDNAQRLHLPHKGKYRDLLTNAVVGQDIDLAPGQGMVVELPKAPAPPTLATAFRSSTR